MTVQAGEIDSAVDSAIDQRARSYDAYVQAIGMREGLTADKEEAIRADTVGPAEIEFQRTQERETERALKSHRLQRGTVSDKPVLETQSADLERGKVAEQVSRDAMRAVSSGSQEETPQIQLDANGVSPEIQFRSKANAKRH